MNKYIDADVLLRDSEILEAVIDDGIEAHMTYCISRNAVRDAPAADVVEVVRCKDCRKFKPRTSEYKSTVEKADGDCFYVLMCDGNNSQIAAREFDDFCSHGERRTN